LGTTLASLKDAVMIFKLYWKMLNGHLNEKTLIKIISCTCFRLNHWKDGKYKAQQGIILKVLKKPVEVLI
jgi:hypothetical protein